MDWSSSGRYDEFRYVLVDKDTMTEVCDLGMFIPGGGIKYDDLSPIKVAGSLPFIDWPDIGFDYLRVYSKSRLGDTEEEVLHGTFTVNTPESDIKGKTKTGTAQISSLLKFVAKASTTDYITIEEGTNAIDYAASIIQGLGLSVIADKSSATLNTPANFKAGDKWLDVIEELCKFAGYASPNVDAAGNIRLYPYIDPTNRAPSFEFIDNERCVFGTPIKYKFDISDVPNVVIAVMSNDEVQMRAVAKNMDPMSIYSIPARGGMELAYEETVNDIDSQNALQALADRRLSELTSAVESIEISHSFQPYQPGEVGSVIYTQADFTFTGAAVNKDITLVRGMPCIARWRRFVRG